MKRFRRLFSRAKADRDLDEELQSYLDLLTEQKKRQGMSLPDARREALVELGGAEQVKEQVRAVTSGHLLEQLLQDVRYGFRSLRHNPAFSAIAILVLALGIGAAAAMFSVGYGILLRPLPYAAADRIAVVHMRFYPRDFAYGTLSIRDFFRWRDNNRAFETPSLFRTLRMDVGSTGSFPEQVPGASVTTGFFGTFQVSPIAGRTFASGEDSAGHGSLCVLSETLWKRRFHSDPSILNKQILINGAASTVIGVMPDTFRFPRTDTEVWTNVPLNPSTRFGPWFYRGVARLKPGASFAQANAELERIATLVTNENPNYKSVHFPMLGLRDAILGTTLKPAILVLSGAVLLVLAIAVANVASLMLARATVRQREMALRLSLGAARGRIVRQLLTESLIIAFAGGAAGIAFGWAAIGAIRYWNPGNNPLIGSVHLDWAAVAFTFAVSAVTGIVFGLAPALESARTDLNSTMKEGGGAGKASPKRQRSRAALVIAEIAVSLTLLLAATLLSRSFANLQRVNGGFFTPPNRVVTALVSPSNPKYKDSATGLAFYDEVLRRSRAVPGIASASVTDSLPPNRQGDADSFQIFGQTLRTGEQNPVVSVVTVTPDHFQTLGIPLLKGRGFTQLDNRTSAPVTIVSEAFEGRFFPNGSALGKRIRHSGPGSDDPWMEIVGVVGNVKYLGVTVDTDPAYYMPLAQYYFPRLFLTVKTSGDITGLSQQLLDAVHSVDPDVTLAQPGTMAQAMDSSLSEPRFDTLLLSAFGAIALLLATVGVYGLISYSVAQRTREIGIRMALGADRRTVLLAVIREGASLAAAGIVLGIAASVLLTKLLSAMLFGIAATDPLTFGSASIAMLGIALLAAAVPALRASRVSPVIALRYE